jgi:hypothetical protein
MDDFLARLSPRDRRAVSRMALCVGVGVNDMALALLQAHLTLIRDCGNILPGEVVGATKSRAIQLGGGAQPRP